MVEEVLQGDIEAKKELEEIIAKHNIKIDIEKLQRQRDRWLKPKLDDSHKRRMMAKVRQIQRQMDKEEEAEQKKRVYLI
jgi:hypothetical protein